MTKEIGGLKEDSFLQTELKLAQDLKQCCDAEGKEINPFMSAPILNEIGLIYRKRSPDKLSLIRSAVLLNASVARQSYNAKFQNDVKEVCSYLLQVAGAHDQKADLVEFSKNVEIQIQQMRNGVKEKLAQLTEIPYEIPDNEFNKLAENKIEIVEGLQNMITEKYKSIMEYVSSECQKTMGTPPCRFNVTGMGSLARGEITPYSDFEHIILLEEGVQHKSGYEKILEYFRWFSVIFHFIIINLQETIVPSVTIPSLNNSTDPEHNWFYDFYTTRGVSFDGLLVHACKFPLGRTQKTKKKPWTTELIKPVSEMLQYLDFEVALENGYHLNEVLKETCFVFGNNRVYSEFVQGRCKVQNNDNEAHQRQRMKQLEEDLDNFNVIKMNNLSSASSCNIKRMVYRSISLFISTLGHLYEVATCSTFKTIRQLRQRGAIKDEVARGLLFALAVACEVRLKLYTAKRRQEDNLHKGETLRDWVPDLRTQVVTIVGERSMVECLTTAHKLQMFLSDMESSRGFLQDRQLTLVSSFYIKPIVLSTLNLHNRVIEEWLIRKKQSYPNQYLEALACFNVGVAFSQLEKFEEALEVWKGLENQLQQNPLLNAQHLRQKSYCLFNLRKWKEVIEHTNKAKLEIASWDILDYDVKQALYSTAGAAKCRSGLFREALSEFRDFFKCPLDKTIPSNHQNTALSLVYVGRCLLELGKADSAIHKGREVLELSKQIKSIAVMDSYRLLSRCYHSKQKYKKSLEYCEKELEGRNETIDLSNNDPQGIVDVKRRIEECKEKLGYYNA
ncbi:unnamed protein product [Clavelina lepadiformis]|uniref:Protein-PII uridylyltransferase N-terminal domain-containing protein n=1 Tax=Clavelina lepadiformis TaxID=159417 RepID=A0ABP0G6M0_CLALP